LTSEHKTKTADMDCHSNTHLKSQGF
jgi:hypothetical protein